MALTLVKQKEGVAGDLRYWTGTMQFDSSYNTGGELLAAADLGFGSTIYLCELGQGGGLVFEYDRTNGKVKAFFPSGGATTPATNTAPTATGTVPAGSTTVTSTSANPTPTVALVAGQGKEVGSTTDLSGVTIQIFALGQ